VANAASVRVLFRIASWEIVDFSRLADVAKR
jgi:hypothetical protein